VFGEAKCVHPRKATIYDVLETRGSLNGRAKENTRARGVTSTILFAPAPREASLLPLALSYI